MRPTKLIILRSQLNPHRVDGILRNHSNVGNDQQAIFLDWERINRQVTHIFLRLLTNQHQRIGIYYKIELIGVMMRSRKRDRVELLVTIFDQCRMLRLDTMPMIATAEHDDHTQQHEQLHPLQSLFLHIALAFNCIHIHLAFVAGKFQTELTTIAKFQEQRFPPGWFLSPTFHAIT